MPETLKKLNADHRNIETLVQIIEKEIETFESGETPDYDLVRMILNYLLTYPDLHHHPLEDAIVRKLKNIHDVPGAAELELEHRKLAGTIRRFLAAITNILNDDMLPRDWFSSIAREFSDFLRKHMRMEEVVIFPAAKRELNDEDWASIDAQISPQKDPLFGSDPDADFADLRARLGME